MNRDATFLAARQGSVLRPLRASATLACALLACAASAQNTAEQGFRIMSSGTGGNCVACHSLPGQAGVASTFGPALSQVGARYSADELRQWVTDARVIKPNTLMPPFGTTAGTNSPMRAQSILNSDEIGHVVAALQTLH
jgi:sulfur-oxidizing protein SoxX